jgi:hypothetical protein
LAVDLLRSATADGESLVSFAADVGVSEGSLRRWLGESEEPSWASAELREVVVVDGDRSPAAAGSATLVTPDGFRIEGVSIAALPQLLLALR